VVDSIDALLVLQLVAALVSELPCGEVADVNGDGLITALDALLILQLQADLIDALPAADGAGWPAALRVDRFDRPAGAGEEAPARLRAAGSDGGASLLTLILASLAASAAIAMGAGLYRWWRRVR
jgi:hypothetical protein